VTLVLLAGERQKEGRKEGGGKRRIKRGKTSE
jgi:hypothetical protein